MDLEVAEWLAELILQAANEISRRPGLTIEVEDDASNWVQVVLESDEETPGSLSGYVLNFPQQFSPGSADAALREAGLSLPPGTRVLAHEPGAYGTIWIRPDIPVAALALLIGDIIEKANGAPAGSEVNVLIEYGF